MSRIICPSLVGRADEWERLVSSLDEAASGRGALACVMGEAGIGKSRLVAEVCEAGRERGLGVLSGRAVDTAHALFNAPEHVD